MLPFMSLRLDVERPVNRTGCPIRNLPSCTLLAADEVEEADFESAAQPTPVRSSMSQGRTARRCPSGSSTPHLEEADSEVVRTPTWPFRSFLLRPTRHTRCWCLRIPFRRLIVCSCYGCQLSSSQGQANSNQLANPKYWISWQKLALNAQANQSQNHSLAVGILPRD